MIVVVGIGVEVDAAALVTAEDEAVVLER